MRTKTLLLTAATVVAGFLSASAQVYSVNVVGYVNKVYTAGGFTMIANPLNGTNNTVANIIQNPRNGMIVYKWAPGFVANGFVGTWGNPTSTLNPGEGAFLFVPAGANYTNTYVGEVLQGSLTNALPTGFSMVGSMVPQAGAMQANLGFPVANGTIVYKWAPGFTAYGYVGSWSPSDPTIDVAEGVFAFTPAASSWVRNFTVQ